jgi:alpha-glucosidase
MLLGLKGTPVMYYGDEIGMTNVYVPPWRIQDPWGVRYWPVFSGRDRSRTPMQWAKAKGAGFTGEDVRPWLPYGHLQGRNVSGQMEESDSTFHFTKDLIELRRRLPDLNLGGYQALPVANGLWAWHRGQHTMVVLNLSIAKKSMRGLSGKILISTDRSKDGDKIAGRLSLEPWQGVIIKLS